MRFSTLFVSTVASASFALAQDDPPAEAVCTGSYPFALNTSSTNPELLTFWVSSSNPLTNGRPLQLREAEDGRTLAVVDATSPVAFGVLENGVLSVENGLTAATRNVTGNETNYVAEVYFENAEEGKQVIDWYLLGLSDPSGRANLYHKARFQTQNGFILCDKGDYWAFHYNAMAQGGPQHECDWIGVQTVVAPYIENGVCVMPPETLETVWRALPPGIPPIFPEGASKVTPLEVAGFLTTKGGKTMA